jgi:hypothetical protein
MVRRRRSRQPRLHPGAIDRGLSRSPSRFLTDRQRYIQRPLRRCELVRRPAVPAGSIARWLRLAPRRIQRLHAHSRLAR